MKNLETKTQSELQEFDHFECQPKDFSLFMKTKLKRVLSQFGLKRKFFPRRFVVDGIEIIYKTNLYEGIYGNWGDRLEVKIMAGQSEETQEKARTIYQTIKEYFNMFNAPTVLENGVRAWGLARNQEERTYLKKKIK